MQLEHSFEVPAGVDDAWAVLLDVERVAPCLPGATLETLEGDDFTGNVKVKLGPINLTYKGAASFVEKDEAAHRVVLDARGKDTRGGGTAAAKVTATLTDRGGVTHVEVLTDLDITGKPAQFGRGVIVDVGNKLIGQFASCLAEEIRKVSTPVAAEPDLATIGTSWPAEPAAAKAAPKPPRREAEAINLMESAGPAVFKRAAPPIAALFLVLVVLRVLRRR
jgi:carbon monoxide dehydrogenase subunit G